MRLHIAQALGLSILLLATCPASGQAMVPAPASQPAAVAGLYGSSSCRECHEPFYQKWASSHHGLAMQPFTDELARARLAPQPQALAIGNAQYRAELSPNGQVIETGPAGERRYPIAHVMGGKNVFYFLTPLERGRLQVLPLAYDVRRQAWIDTTGSAVRHFGDRRDQALDWREPQLTFNTSCYGCHVSQLAVNYDLKTDTYRTTWTEPGINCETCHGPGEAHVKLFRGLPPGEKVDDIRIINTRKFNVEQLNTMCAPCHAKMAALSVDFKPDGRYFDHYDLVTLEDPDFYPDGRDLGENYTFTSWRMSPCVKAGELSCMHCHTSSGRNRHSGAEANNACLPCHRERVENATAHTHHAADSEGNRCVSCHMPMTEFARMRRTDHSMRPPAPAATLAFKSPNACNLCHTDKDAAWADKLVREWRARDYQAPILERGRLIEAARRGDWSRLPEMLAGVTGPQRDEVFANSLVRLLRSCEDERKWPALVAAAQDPSPLLRSSAVDGLAGRTAPESIGALLAGTRDEYRLVRIRAAAALAGMPLERASEADRKSLTAATAEFLQVVTARPDDHAAHYNRGNFHMSRGELAAAVECFETSTRLQPVSIPPLVNASLAYNALSRNDKAEESLRRALKIDPANPAANLNLGLLLAEMGRLPEAESALRAAFKADPRSAVAAYNLAVITAGDRLDEAVDWCRKAHEIRPADAKYTFTLAFYLRSRGDAAEAFRLLEGAVKHRPAQPDVYLLLGRMHEEQGRLPEAAAVYRQALSQAQLSPEDRMALEERILQLTPR